MTTLNREYYRKVIAENLRRLRGQHRHTQAEAAKKAGVSARLLQSLELGKGNPTIETLGTLALLYDTTIFELLEMKFVRLNAELPVFQERFIQAFRDSPFGAVLRSPAGTYVWANPHMDSVSAPHFGAPGDGKNSGALPLGSRGIIQKALECEQRNIVRPFTVAVARRGTEQECYLRVYPKLIFPHRGENACIVASYVTDFEQDHMTAYQRFTQTLLEIS